MLPSNNIQIQKVTNGFIVTKTIYDYQAYVGAMGSGQRASTEVYICNDLDEVKDMLDKVLK